MFGTQNLATFVSVGILLNLTPGPDTMYILARGAAQGVRAGVLSALGISTGGLIHTLAAATGLSIILASSATVFTIIKYVGAAYLIALGIGMLLRKVDPHSSAGKSSNGRDGWTVYRQGALTNVLNPKVAVFFLAFLPQFVDPSSGHTVIPFVILGCIFVTTGTIWCVLVGALAGKMSLVLRTKRSVQLALNRISGAVFIALGGKLALERS
ncbi:MAG: LysE family translocator [Phycisphaerales bacterium]|nr:MAG: LysE family translocator [Phycisphaerales bacterium]